LEEAMRTIERADLHNLPLIWSSSPRILHDRRWGRLGSFARLYPTM